jgi:hypothetical protein
MRRDFGLDEPTMAQTIERNPRAMLEHFVWNATLIPAGLQLQLFNSVSGTRNPDYVLVTLKSRAALMLSLGALLGGLCGAAILLRDRQFWWNEWLKDRCAGWVALGCLSVTAAFVMIMQRPRPSYLFNESATLLALLGTALMGLLGLRRAEQLGRVVTPILAVLLVAFVPSYHDVPPAFRQRGQPLQGIVRRLAPYRDTIAGERRLLLAPRFAHEICCYVGGSHPCRSGALVPVIRSKPPDRSPAAWLEEERVDLIYAEDPVSAGNAVREFLDGLEGSGWQRLAPTSSTLEQWRLLHRTADGDAGSRS